MATTSAKYPTSDVSSTLINAGGLAWGTTGNAGSSNDTRSSALLAGGSAPTATRALYCSGFGFTSADVPVGSTIDGITVTIERSKQGVGAATSTIADYSVRLVNGSAAVAGDDKKDTVTGWPATNDSTANYGGAADDWNASLTQADVVDTDFGVAISANITVGPANVQAAIDSVTVTIDYTEAAASGMKVIATFL